VKLGTTTPVLLVHGFNEGPSVFTSGSPSLVEAITAALGSAVTPLTFDYHMANTDWVTDAAIGPQLAQCITWLANTSAKQRGPGKVIVVAHSMGGLAVRCAVDPVCVNGEDGRAAANPDLIGLVITLGTPNLGSNPQSLGPVGDTVCSWFPDCNTLLILRKTPAAKAIVAGSTKLANLAPLSASIPVDALAGKITFTTSLFGSVFGGINGGITDDGDIVVPVASALAEAPSGVAHAGSGAKSTTIDCGSIPIDQIGAWSAVSLAAKTPVPPVTCWHLTETTNAVW
jgi:pimeloyl-ACP methyl ester carboxylesterase